MPDGGGRRGGYNSVHILNARRGCVVDASLRPLYPWKERGTHCTEGWADIRIGLDGSRKCRLRWGSNPGLSTCGESLYRLRCPGRMFVVISNQPNQKNNGEYLPLICIMWRVCVFLVLGFTLQKVEERIYINTTKLVYSVLAFSFKQISSSCHVKTDII